MTFHTRDKCDVATVGAAVDRRHAVLIMTMNIGVKAAF